MAVSISGSDGFSLDGKISVSGPMMNRIPTIEDPLEIKFTTDTRFQIIDTNTNTVISERDYDFDSQIIFNDLKIALDKMPAQGDSFKITANLNSAGDNSNLQRLLLIQDAQELSGATLQQGYERALSKVGAVNSLAKISEEALEVVYEDAVTLESSISGVSLDDEAADLIRFQQSFQAAAQVIKVSSTIFDSILSASR
jgi:flagellar hook-associated protein 1 FlgK